MKFFFISAYATMKGDFRRKSPHLGSACDRRGIWLCLFAVCCLLCYNHLMLKDKKIAVVAGRERLPDLVMESLRRSGYEPYLIALKNFYDGALRPDLTVRLGGAGAAIKELKRRGITQIIFIGALGHPNLFDIRPDWASVKILAKIIKNQRGYDSMIATLIAEIEKLGFKILNPQHLCPDLTFGKGVQTKTKPSRADLNDIKRGTEVSGIIGKMDIGQSVVVHNQVLAVEAAEGTERMLSRVIEMRRANKYKGGVMVKLIKPGQDLRIDTTAIGANTIRDLAAARIGGLVIDAKECWVIDMPEAIRLANKHKIFILAI